MAVVSVKSLLETGVHFGHQTKRWNPKMGVYIHAARKDIHIIDLRKTAAQIELAYAALHQIVLDGGKVLFVGTKKQAQEAVKEEAIRTGHFYVDNRWLGGTLTNFKTIRKRVGLLQELYTQEENGDWSKLPKKEVIGLAKKREKLEKNLGGIKEMKSLPQAIFVIDPKTEEIAVKEARKLNIPIFGIVDTNCDPDLVDFVIPANDDAIRAVKLITWVMGNAIAEAQGEEVEKFEDEMISFENPEKYAPKSDRPERAEKVDRPEKAAKPKEAKPAETKTETAEPKAKPAKKVEKVKETPEESTTVEVDLESLKLTELKEVAKNRGIEGYSNLKKAELLALLKK